MAVQDVIAAGLEKGWRVTQGASLTQDLTAEADVVIIGTGAGGGTTAEILAQAGLRVILVEEGKLYHQKDFRMDELESYTRLYQEGMSRMTADGAISILQGRCVGGSTTVNWTSSFRTPKPTLDYWTDALGVRDCREADMAPWFADREARLNIQPWGGEPNENNSILKRGCERLGWEWSLIPRNVVGCWNIGYCGMGCPTNAKQSTLVTTVPGALDAGAQLFHGLRAERLVHRQGRIEALEAVALDQDALHPTGIRVTLRARHFVVSASALGSPALLLRSGLPDPYGRVGKRTFLHPVNATVAEMPQPVEPYYGAPQSIYSDEFVWKQGTTGRMGFKLEVPPLHPAMAVAVLPLHGNTLQTELQRLPHLQATLALLRDGFHAESTGGEVSLRSDGSPILDYPLNDYLWQGAREAYLRMAEVQFAAGASRVRLVHMDSPSFLRWPEAKQAIQDIPMAPHRARLFTAHQMGGCAMGEDPRTSVVDSYGVHHQVRNLSIHDASIFPTSIGANPQLSVYAFSARNTQRLRAQLSAG